MRRTRNDFHAREILSRVIANRIAVGIDHNLRNLRAREQLKNNLVIQRPPRERAVILPRHAPAFMTHRNNGSDRRLHSLLRYRSGRSDNSIFPPRRHGEHREEIEPQMNTDKKWL